MAKSSFGHPPGGIKIHEFPLLTFRKKISFCTETASELYPFFLIEALRAAFQPLKSAARRPGQSPLGKCEQNRDGTLNELS